MIEIKDKTLCTGCGACTNACPKNIIKLKEDEEGCWYPIVSVDSCINCGMCDKVCPLVNFEEKKQKGHNGYPQFFAGQLKDEKDLFEVSSGGAFWALAQAVISNNGVIYGAAQINVDIIKHLRVDNIEDAKKLRRSKYFQSDTNTVFIQAKKDLKAGRKVLFCGTPCQIAAINSFLGKPNDYLYTCEIVCHGVPSRKIWRVYRKEKEQQEGKLIKELVFRDKSAGWQSNQYKIVFDDGSIEKERSTIQLFHAGYLSGLFYRPSCGSCKFASLPRQSDITLADFWKYSGIFHHEGKDVGVSLISINTEKGRNLLSNASKFLNIEATSKELALASCKHMDEHPSPNPYRAKFFKEFKELGYSVAVKKYLVPPKQCLVKRIIKRIIKN